MHVVKCSTKSPQNEDVFAKIGGRYVLHYEMSINGYAAQKMIVFDIFTDEQIELQMTDFPQSFKIFYVRSMRNWLCAVTFMSTSLIDHTHAHSFFFGLLHLDIDGKKAVLVKNYRLNLESMSSMKSFYLPSADHLAGYLVWNRRYYRGNVLEVDVFKYDFNGDEAPKNVLSTQFANTRNDQQMDRPTLYKDQWVCYFRSGDQYRKRVSFNSLKTLYFMDITNGQRHSVQTQSLPEFDRLWRQVGYKSVWHSDRFHVIMQYRFPNASLWRTKLALLSLDLNTKCWNRVELSNLMVDSHFLDRIDIHVDDDECMTLKIARNKTTDFQFYRCQLGKPESMKRLAWFKCKSKKLISKHSPSVFTFST